LNEIENIRKTLAEIFNAASTPEQVQNLVQKELDDTPPPTPYHLLIMLRLAAHKGNEPAAKLLLQRGAVIDNVATYNAIHPGDSIPVLQAFADAGWDVNMPLAHDGDALVVAINRNKVEIVRWLLEHGANVSLHEGVNGRTTLGNAAVQASPDIISMLVKSGAELKGSRALELAAHAGRVDNAAILLDLGADINEVPSADSWCVPNQDIEAGLGSALHAAASEGHTKVVSLLLEKGADVHLKDSKGRTALERARIAKHAGVVALLAAK
jgi:ankyrin repeat protein